MKRVEAFRRGKGAQQIAPVVPEPPPEPRKNVVKSREGKRSVNVFVNQDAFRQLRLLSVDKDRPILDLMREAMDMLFSRYGLPEIAKREE